MNAYSASIKLSLLFFWHNPQPSHKSSHTGGAPVSAVHSPSRALHSPWWTCQAPRTAADCDLARFQIAPASTHWAGVVLLWGMKMSPDGDLSTSAILPKTPKFCQDLPSSTYALLMYHMEPSAVYQMNSSWSTFFRMIAPFTITSVTCQAPVRTSSMLLRCSGCTPTDPIWQTQHKTCQLTLLY